MMDENIPLPTYKTASTDRKWGCGSTALHVITIVWIIVASGIAQFISWTIEQGIFDGSFKDSGPALAGRTGIQCLFVGTLDGNLADG